MIPSAKKERVLNVSVFEHGLLSSSKKSSQYNIQHIPEPAYEHLRGMCLRDDSTSRLLIQKIAFGIEVIQVQNYAGVIICPDGTRIEVLPKIAKVDAGVDAAENSRQSLLMMLRTLRQFRHVQTDSASIKKQKLPLLDVFIYQFLMSVNNLIKKGVKNDYIVEQSNNSFLKGKLLQSQQLKKNFLTRHRFYVEFDSYQADTAANRVIHSALNKVSRYTNSSENQKLLQELLFAFEGIPLSKDYKNDFSIILLGRGMSYYEAPIIWARLVLEGFSPLAMSGIQNAFSLLFPMEVVFENFVAQYLRQKVILPQKISTQIQSKSLVSYGGKNYFRLKPDICLHNESGNDIIMDTKWKLIDQNRSSGKDKFGLSQNDFYQMLGYGHKYLNGVGELVLIYPKTAHFDRPLEHIFKYDDKDNLKLKVVPFDVSHQCVERIDLNYIGIKDQRLPNI